MFGTSDSLRHHVERPVSSHVTPPDAARQSSGAGRVSELDLEIGEVDPSLLAGLGLLAALMQLDRRWPDLAQEIGHRRIAAGIAAFPDLPKQAHAR